MGDNAISRVEGVTYAMLRWADGTAVHIEFAEWLSVTDALEELRKAALDGLSPDLEEPK